MTVEHLVCPDCDEVHAEDMHVLEFCVVHNSVLDALVQQRNLNLDERTEVVSSMLVGVVHTMGPAVFEQHGGCPVCVLEGTLERAADDVAIRRRKSN